MVWQIAINGYDNNFSYFVGDIESRHVAVVDPGDVGHLVSELDSENLTPLMVLLTHSHADHTSGVDEMMKRFGIPVYMHKNAQDRVEVPGNMVVLIDDGDIVKVGGLQLEVLHTPGHIDDAVCFYVPKEQDENGIPRLITGDTLFVEACGRADLENSNVEHLYESLQRIKKFPDETKIYPGHDYGSKLVSNLAWEKENNKFLRCETLEEFIRLRLPSL